MRTWPALELGPLGDTELLHAFLADYDIAAIEELPASWRVFFHDIEARHGAAAALQRTFPNLVITAIDVPDDDWAARSQSSLRAVTIGNIVVAPPWDVPGRHDATVRLPSTALGPRKPDTTTIVIQPSMGFGTGHHATTRLCLAAMQHLDLRGRRVLDVGTGSGVLAIAASLLGATESAGIDPDADAIQAAGENVLLNPGAAVTLAVADLREIDAVPFDAVLANLTGALLIQAADRLRDLTAPGGSLILSGFMHAEEAAVRAAYSDLAIEHRAEEDEWVCVRLSSP